MQEVADHVVHRALTVGHIALGDNVLILHTLGREPQVRRSGRAHCSYVCINSSRKDASAV